MAKSYFNRKAWEVAKDYLPRDKWLEFYSYAIIHSNLGLAYEDASCGVISQVVQNLPGKLGEK